jgi:alpha-D-xyloside xylohydrolase
VENKDGKMKGSISDPEKGKPNTISQVTWKFMTTPVPKPDEKK